MASKGNTVGRPERVSSVCAKEQTGKKKHSGGKKSLAQKNHKKEEIIDRGMSKKDLTIGVKKTYDNQQLDALKKHRISSKHTWRGKLVVGKKYGKAKKKIGANESLKEQAPETGPSIH